MFFKTLEIVLWMSRTEITGEEGVSLLLVD